MEQLVKNIYKDKQVLDETFHRYTRLIEELKKRVYEYLAKELKEEIIVTFCDVENENRVLVRYWSPIEKITIETYIECGKIL